MRRGRGEALANVAIAGTFAIAGVRAALHGGSVAWMLGGFQLAVALAFWLREPERRGASWANLAAAVPSFVVAGAVIAVGGPAPWPTPAVALVALGSALAIGGLISLGRSFAVLPGVRTLRTGGLYRFVRHPVYLGELLILTGAATRIGWLGLTGVVCAVPLLGWRISIEERLLSTEAGWTAWATRVRWRLLPGVW